jgi:pyrroloquinoline quinone (PQQ) biosynthesis protein C
LQEGDTHHYQLSRAFAKMGTKCILQDEEFGSLDELQKLLDPATANFVSLVQNIYPQSLGPWCVIEMFAHDWMQALMNSLAHCFPFIKQEQYFAECFEQGVEERHSQEAKALTSIILRNSPQLLEQTIAGAEQMATGLDRFWSGLEVLLKDN